MLGFILYLIVVGIVAGYLPPLPAAVEVAAYRIVQEALTNAVRHARAARITIRASAVRSIGLRLSVADRPYVYDARRDRYLPAGEDEPEIETGELKTGFTAGGGFGLGVSGGGKPEGVRIQDVALHTFGGFELPEGIEGSLDAQTTYRTGIAQAAG